MKKKLSFLTIIASLAFMSGYSEELSYTNSNDIPSTASILFEKSLLKAGKSPHQYDDQLCNGFFQTPINQYNVLLTLGMDEFLPTSPVTPGVDGFKNILDWDDATIERFRQSVISYYNTRFGIDFSTGIYDPATGITTLPYAFLLPLTFGGDYRLLSSNYNKLSVNPDNPPFVRALEYVCLFTFDESTESHFYGGTYASVFLTPIPVRASDSLDYGVYHIVETKKCKQRKTYDIFARSYFPNHVEYNSQAVIYPYRISETVQLYSAKFGSGVGFLNVANPSTPNSVGLFPVFIRGTFSFPGSFVLPDLNGFTQSPI
jgi:hypothetical protein